MKDTVKPLGHNDPSLISSDMKVLREYTSEVLRQKKRRDIEGIKQAVGLVKKIADNAMQSVNNENVAIRDMYIGSSL